MGMFYWKIITVKFVIFMNAKSNKFFRPCASRVLILLRWSDLCKGQKRLPKMSSVITFELVQIQQ